MGRNDGEAPVYRDRGLSEPYWPSGGHLYDEGGCVLTDVAFAWTRREARVEKLARSMDGAILPRQVYEDRVCGLKALLKEELQRWSPFAHWTATGMRRSGEWKRRSPLS